MRASEKVLVLIDSDAVLVLDVFSKKTTKTSRRLIDKARRLLARYDAD